ncbi:MAG: hypothetical protein HY560_01560 [Gemmatimonadetes bacterium]|nr:hypothetical protein [Gemmatimonadota bacterium]
MRRHSQPAPAPSAPSHRSHLTSHFPTRARIRDALLAAGGAPAAGRLATHPTAPIAAPFGTAEPVEHPRVRAIPVTPVPPPASVGFLDGIQRYSHEGSLGLAPVVRGYVAAAVLGREGDGLRARFVRHEEFLVAPLARLSPEQQRALTRIGLPLRECETRARAHPLVDIQLAVAEVERARERTEHAVAAEFTAASAGAWLVVDGVIGGVTSPTSRTIGVIKSHETQFLDGPDLEVALTLPNGSRSSVFARTTGGGARVYTWYLRLWPWEGENFLHGLVRIERVASGETVAEADQVSGWLLNERTPLSTPDGRWDRLLYPIHLAEDFLKARAGSWV